MEAGEGLAQRGTSSPFIWHSEASWILEVPHSLRASWAVPSSILHDNYLPHRRLARDPERTEKSNQSSGANGQ